MSHLSNPLATADQLYHESSVNALPVELQDSIRFYAARLTQAAGILLRLPQDITAQANVLLFRYWIVDDLMDHEFSVSTFYSMSGSKSYPIDLGLSPTQDVSAATIYLTAKISASPRSLRSITNVYAYLLSSSSALSTSSPSPPDLESCYLSESAYVAYRNRLLNIEGQILNAIGFNTHVALPHPLAITYLQTLDAFSPNQANINVGKEVGKVTIEYLNTALLSPQMLYLTHQPCALATAAIYLAARDKGLKLPECEWWEVFDCEREELGFLVVGMGSLAGLVSQARETWGEKGMITREDARAELKRRRDGLDNGNGHDNGTAIEDEEAEMARMMDKKVGAA